MNCQSTMPFLKDPSISAKSIYYLTTSEEIKKKPEDFYDLTNIETPAPNAQKSAFSEQLT
ncbi:MAG: hypothetical protein WD577_01180 [Bacteroidales bacterium]